MCNESNVFILFYFLWGCNGGALVFLGGAGAPASPSLAPPMCMSVCNVISMETLVSGLLCFMAYVKIHKAFFSSSISQTFFSVCPKSVLSGLPTI